jgi:hypothetical protein
MANAVLNLGAFSPTELTAMLAAAKIEYLARMSQGRVKSGGSASQQYSMDIMTLDQLIQLMNSLTTELGLDNDTLTVRPNFNDTRLPIGEGSAFGTY